MASMAIASMTSMASMASRHGGVHMPHMHNVMKPRRMCLPQPLGWGVPLPLRVWPRTNFRSRSADRSVHTRHRCTDARLIPGLVAHRVARHECLHTWSGYGWKDLDVEIRLVPTITCWVQENRTQSFTQCWRGRWAWMQQTDHVHDHGSSNRHVYKLPQGQQCSYGYI